MAKLNHTPGVLAPPPLIYSGTLAAAWLFDTETPWGIFRQDASLLGVILLAIGGLLAASAILTMRRAGAAVSPYKTSRVLVTKGPFRLSRNPIYLALTLAYLGLALLLNTAWALLLLPILIGVMVVGVILREERYLLLRFGGEYLKYKFKVRRWF